MEMEAAVVDTQKPQQQAQEEPQKHFHVLAVDDSVLDRKLLEKLLSLSPYKVTFVDSGDKALEYLGLLGDSPTAPSQSQEGLKVNLIMTDYCMPGMTGYELLKRIKGSYWKDVPVVVMSSENVPSRINMCLEEGAEEFLLKPLQMSDLERVHHYLLRSSGHSCGDDNVADVGDKGKEEPSGNILTKSKADLAEPSERRPNVKGVAVV